MPQSAVKIILALLSLSLLTGCDRGGERVQLLLEAKGAGASEEAMDSARAVVERRIGALGSSGATVVRQPPNRLLVTLSRAGDAGAVRALVGRRGRLDFSLVDLTVNREQLDSGLAPPGTRILPFADGSDRVPVQARPVVTGSMIADAQAGFDPAGNPTVTIRFDSAGRLRFARATRDNVGRPFAIVLDDKVISAPNINEPILGGEAMISGNFTVDSANQLAIALRSGALPVDLAVIEERVIGR